MTITLVDLSIAVIVLLLPILMFFLGYKRGLIIGEVRAEEKIFEGELTFATQRTVNDIAATLMRQSIEIQNNLYQVMDDEEIRHLNNLCEESKSMVEYVIECSASPNGRTDFLGLIRYDNDSIQKQMVLNEFLDHTDHWIDADGISFEDSIYIFMIKANDEVKRDG